MTSTNKLFELAQLAEASYAKFYLFPNQVDAALLDNGFSAAQAKAFNDNWQVVTQQPDTASSFSGTLFKYIGTDANSGFQNGQYVYALKGTLEPIGDLLGADGGDIVTDGLAIDQSGYV